MYHEHPLKILKNASKNIWLLIFPLLRGIKTMHLDFDVFYNWIKGAWFDILVVLVILGYGYMRWIFTWLRFGENEVTLISGIFIKMETTIPYENISAVSAEHPFYLRPFKAVRLKINTCGGNFSSSDMSLLMRRSDSWQLHHKMPVSHDKKKKTFEIHPKLLTIIFFSFVFSSSFSGAFYIAALFFQLGKSSKDLLEHELKDALNQLTSEVSSKFALSIPPAAIIVGILIIFTWLMSFIFNIFRYAGFTMKRDKNSLKIKMGAVTRRNYHIITNKINYIDMRQNIIMKIFKKTSLNISCSGYGNQKNELPVLLPILSRRQANNALDILDFGKRIGKRSVKANRAAVLTFLGLPLCFCIGIPISAAAVMHFFPSVSELVVPFAVMAELPSVWMIVVKTLALLTTGLSIEDNFICIRYSRFFAFHTVLADRKKLVKAQIIQNPIQKMIGRCRLDFYFNAEMPKKNKLHGINIKDAEKILKILDMDK